MQYQNKIVYPFSAIVGQDKMKLALILNVINPKIGGVLLRGEKGTGKSLTVRALANLLPEVEVITNCPFHCDPKNLKDLCDACASKNATNTKLPTTKRVVSVVELPVGATEDRLVGTIDIEKAIKTGEKHFDPGILAQANRNLLYIDEVNLLDDHLVDVLLDVAAMGVNFVEREGVSFSHPSHFVLIGTMNPEEGELRPQLLDRFALSVEVKGIPYREARAEIIRRRIAFESNPSSFVASTTDSQESIRQKILSATVLLPKVTLSSELLDLITQICTDFAVDGHRADIVMYKTACTIAAYNGRIEVTEEDIKEAAELVLPHRQRRQPFEEPKMEQQQINDSIQNWNNNKQTQPQNNDGASNSDPSDNDSSNNDAPDKQDKQNNPDEPTKEQLFQADEPYTVKPLSAPVLDEIERHGSGRRSKIISDSKRGHYVASMLPRGKVTDLAFDATFRAAAPFQKRRKEVADGPQNALLIERCDMREKIRETKMGNLIMFVVDASGSMAAEERMSATKGAVLSLLLDAYQRRDRVGMVVFRKNSAELVLPPTNSVELAQKHLTNLPTGGRTPLAHGLKLGLGAVVSSIRTDDIPLLVLVSDGRANVNLYGGDPVEEAKNIAYEIASKGIQSITIDTEQGFLNFGLVKQISETMGSKYLRLDELRAAPIASAVRTQLISDLSNISTNN
ncbi:putative cobaltochelatase [Candidatus Bathycorpusculum sp.]|uniref:putative cobaltochelatase n=1 Tax=Candidatus Bathycorpusculum sp. TaxID=2994959 RepID=UPI002827F167|nr:putative cobaltochelatase [Candidatus Termitimicrobium sp.]MCL2685810.1 putative cobaltochelatase [Candidatus Termitimicrobium sp.]